MKVTLNDTLAAHRTKQSKPDLLEYDVLNDL